MFYESQLDDVSEWVSRVGKENIALALKFLCFLIFISINNAICGDYVDLFMDKIYDFMWN